ncbi:unnamed protein product [Allacma fusca]|uniref:Diacylglycerol O-acyltransferase n=1 Tax=Allacma fusca TaxID=39272 RepID=A0A8J2K2V1_9HEXA|nr:unnamed protein product [Allacma fusca]
MVSGLDRDDHGDSLTKSLSTKTTTTTATSTTPATNTKVGKSSSDGRDKKKQAGLKIPPQLAPYYKNAPVKRLKHPLEENIFSSLFITLIAVGIAIIVGVPVLLCVGAILIVVLSLRYISVIFVDCCSYVRFICSNRNVPNRPPPRIFPTDHLGVANDVRWLGKRSPDKCQSILHTVLVFEGSMDLLSLRHLVQTRVLSAETPEGEFSYPRLVQKMVPLVTGYRWELDVHFDIQNHIFHGPPHLRSESQVQQYLSFLLHESLPMGKPLWEIRVLSNYGAQKDTLAILRIHQCLADGMTLVRILSHSLADHQQMHIPQRPHFAGLSFGFNVLRSLIVGPFTVFLWLFTTFRDRNLFSKPLAASDKRKTKKNKVKKTTKSSASVQSAGKSPSNKSSCTHSESSVTPEESSPRGTSKQSEPNKSSASASSGLWKVLWSASLTVPKVARVKQIMRSSFNDVMLSAAAGSVRSYLQKQGISYPDDVKVVIPVDLRNDIASPKTSTKLGCKVASVLATIPSGIEAAIPRLWSTRHRMDELKASADPVVAYGATAVLMNILPHRLGTSVLDSLTNKASLQFCNLPGPSSTLVVGGFPLKGVYPIYPPSGEIRVAVSVFTYADQVHVTVVTHRSLRNAGPLLLHGMTNQVDQLSRQLSQRRVPGESRRSARHMSTNNAEITKPPTRQIHIKLQVVQEELQQLSHRLDWAEGQDDRSVGEASSLQLSPGGHSELRTRLKSLKNEFTELIGELRRRSSIVEGVTISFEDEEMEEEFRKPRKRALSVVSVTRRNSIFSSKSLTTPESSQCYSSDDDLSSTTTPPPPDIRMYSPNLRHTSQSIRTTAV